MIVCQCEVVRCSDIRDAVDHGACSVNSVCGSTGAGRQCGGCVFGVKRVLCDHLAAIQAAQVEALGDEVAS